MTDATHTAAELAELDRIARQIDIDAPAERVWELVARPGWYINDGTVDAEPDLRYEDDVAVVRHPEMGEFRFRTVELDKPRYAAFRWIGTPSRDESTPSTLVEFWIEERDGGGVTLRVVESGFSGLADDPADWLKQREGNDKGWLTELQAAKTFVEADTQAPAGRP
ncbi:SRPBCC domain-containing protein [Streptomyces griseosporeus]|uniref:SRPBCC domain-containing protein n=1 Tax=Streptomyces griseosporeus TaxID=1910 RepID=UPI00167DC9B4|nr:SRPBCC domain-containing protein [Streptomyces griseosporeus]GHF46366.1 toxin [Streptomyces griseosporeus]